MTNEYEQRVRKELQRWQEHMQQRPSLIQRKTEGLQRKLNAMIPDKVHRTLTAAIKAMIHAVLFASEHTTPKPRHQLDLQATEYLVADKISFYTKAAAAEGGITGLGGIAAGFADFPLFLSIKMKMLFEIAALYGYDLSQARERLYLLHIFQLTFSSQNHRNAVFQILKHWDEQKPVEDLNQFDWLKFQQEYRDHIDLAKLAQLLPGVGAVVGFLVNKRLTARLGHFAMQAYRMRRLS